MLPKIIQRILSLRSALNDLVNRYDSEKTHFAKLDSHFQTGSAVETNTFTAKNVYEAQQTISSGVFQTIQKPANGIIAPANGTVFVVTPQAANAPVTLSFSVTGIPNSDTMCSFTLILEDCDTAGSVTWPSNCTFAPPMNVPVTTIQRTNGATITVERDRDMLSYGPVEIYTVSTTDGGAHWEVNRVYSTATEGCLPTVMRMLAILMRAYTGMAIYPYETLPASGAAGCLYMTAGGLFVWDAANSEFVPYDYDGSRMVLSAGLNDSDPGVPTEYSQPLQ